MKRSVDPRLLISILSLAVAVGAGTALGRSEAELEAALSLAQAHAEAGQPAASLRLLDALRDGPGVERVLAQSGLLRFAIGDYQGAVADFRQLCALAPEQPAARRNLLLALYRAERYDEADEVLSGLGAVPDSRSLAIRGLLAARRGDFEAAVTDLKKAALEAPNDIFAPYELGLLYLGRGLVKDAAEAFRETIRRDPAAASAHFNLATALARQGDRESAAQALAVGRQLSDRQVDAQRRRQRAVGLAVRAQEARQRGELEAARRDLLQALEEVPDDPGLLALLEQLGGGKTDGEP